MINTMELRVRMMMICDFNFGGLVVSVSNTVPDPYALSQ